MEINYPKYYPKSTGVPNTGSEYSEPMLADDQKANVRQ